MASEQPPVYDQDEQLEPMEEPTADLDAAWQDSISDRGIQIPFFVSQSVAGQWKDRWGDSPEAFYYRVPLLDLMQRVEALCQK